MNEQKDRIDYVGHGLSTLSQWLDARAEDPAVTEELWDPKDLARPAGSRGSVPGLDYSAVPYEPPSGELPGEPLPADQVPEFEAEDPGQVPVTPVAPEPEKADGDRTPE